jgi:hypothetical protein
MNKENKMGHIQFGILQEFDGMDIGTVIKVLASVYAEIEICSAEHGGIEEYDLFSYFVDCVEDYKQIKKQCENGD